MKKFIFFLFVSSLSFSQNVNSKIQTYLEENRSKLNLTQADISSWFVESTANSESTGIFNYYIKQKYQGIEVFNSLSNIWIKNDIVINGGEGFIQNIASKTNTTTPSINVLDAFSRTLTELNETQVQNVIILEQNGFKMKLSNGNLTSNPVLANLVYQLTENDELRLAWDLNFYTQNYKHLWSIRLDAVTGKIIDKFDMIITCKFGSSDDHSKHQHNYSKPFVNQFAKNFYKAKTALEVQSGSYRVYPFNIESPNHGNRQLLASPHNLIASPFGWHDTNGAAGAEFTTTRGNNVHAQEDTDSDNATIGNSPDGGASLLFDFPYGGNGVAATTYQDASLTNLYYMNNIMHDVWYQYGFNEANGNFQSNNYGKGGASGDYVIADGQDATAFNNASFGTPIDGTSGRMQMYLWNQPPLPKLTITSPSSLAGSYSILNNIFDPGNVPLPIPPASLANQLVVFDDGTPDNTDACTPAINAAEINGKIVIVRRGDCTFISKALAAQNAGAIAVIVVNNVAGGLNMSGADGSITIPCVLTTQALGEALITAIQNGDIVNGSIQGIPEGALPFINADGSFDNGIMAHEYGHGISNRLAGGPNNSSCLSNAEQMGEGWSDWFWLMMQIKPTDNGTEIKGIGTYATSVPINGTGIRTYPYSTNTSINPFTFISTNTETVPHGVGSVWATILWDLTWAYIQKYGFNPDVYNSNGLNMGNNRVMRLVLDAIKLQPCNPSLIMARNAILAADQATTNGQDYCMIWRVFAARGMGITASSGGGQNGGGNVATNQVENFTQPTPGTTPATGSNCTTLAIDSFDKTNLLQVYPNPSNGKFTVKLNNYSKQVNVLVTDLNGRVVFNKKDNNIDQGQTFNLNNLQAGMYILKIENNEVNVSKKIIIE